MNVPRVIVKAGYAGTMPLKGEAVVRVAVTPPSQKVPATPRRRHRPPNQMVRRLFSRDEGVASTFCDGASPLPVAATPRSDY